MLHLLLSPSSGAAILYSVIEVPFMIAFLGTDDSPTLVGLDLVVTIIFSIDIFVSFNVPYVNPTTNKMVLDRQKIATSYMKLWFWIDCLATIPFDTIALAFNNGINIAGVRLVRILRLFRLTKVLKFSKQTEESFKSVLERWNIDPIILSGMALVIQIFFVAHLIGCFWFFITTTEATGDTVPASLISDPTGTYNAPIRTWANTFYLLDKEGNAVYYVDASLSTQYIASLYWTFFTMLTVGYGDLRPTNTGERFFALMTMLVGSLLFGAIIAKVREVIESRNLLLKESSRKEEAFKSFIEEKRIPRALKLLAKDAYTYYIKLRPNLSEEGLYNELPKGVALRLTEYTYNREITQINIFRDFFDRNFVMALMIHSRPFLANLGQVLYDEGEMAECMTFVLRGSVRITQTTLRNRQTLLGYATAGHFFGDFEYYKRTVRLARYQTERNCTMYSVDFTRISEAVEEHFEAGVKFLSILKSRHDAFGQVLQSQPSVLPIVVTKAAKTTAGGMRASGKASKSGKSGMSLPDSVHGTSRKIAAFGESIKNAAISLKAPDEKYGAVSSSRSDDSVEIHEDVSTAVSEKPAVQKPNYNMGRRETKLLGTRNHRRGTNSGGGAGIAGYRRPSANALAAGSFWVDGEQIINESIDDAIATEAVINFAMNSASNGIRYPCVIGLNNLGKDIIAEKTMAFFTERGVFHPTHRVRVVWDVFLTSLILYSLLVVPLEMVSRCEPSYLP